jgi:hypothetical protein
MLGSFGEREGNIQRSLYIFDGYSLLLLKVTELLSLKTTEFTKKQINYIKFQNENSYRTQTTHFAMRNHFRLHKSAT